jgi:hypothetical protein
MQFCSLIGILRKELFINRDGRKACAPAQDQQNRSDPQYAEGNKAGREKAGETGSVRDAGESGGAVVRNEVNDVEKCGLFKGDLFSCGKRYVIIVIHVHIGGYFIVEVEGRSKKGGGKLRIFRNNGRFPKDLLKRRNRMHSHLRLCCARITRVQKEQAQDEDIIKLRSH